MHRILYQALRLLAVVCVLVAYSPTKALAIVDGVTCSPVTDNTNGELQNVGGSFDLVAAQQLSIFGACAANPGTRVRARDTAASASQPVKVFLNSFNDGTPHFLDTFIIFVDASVSDFKLDGDEYTSGTQIIVATGDAFSRVVTYTFGENNFTFTVSKDADTNTLNGFTVTAVLPNIAPSISSNGSGTTAAINVAENQIAVTTVTATDPEGDAVTFSLTDGADQGKFSITSGGMLTFQSAPDFETPASDAGTNAYVVEVTATDDGAGSLTDVQTITVTVTDVEAAQTISFTNPGAQAFSAGGTVSLRVTGGGSGNAVTLASTTLGVCTVAGSTVTMVSVGTCSITADQAAGNDFAAATQVSEDFAIGQGTNVITFNGPADTALTSPPVTVAATSSSGLAVSFASTTASICTVSGTTVTLVSVGTCSITASQAGVADFVAASDVVQTFAVTSGTNVITFNDPADTDFTVGSMALSATASSGLSVSFASTTASACTVSGTTVTLVSIGTCSITASQAGNANFVAAADVVRSFSISGATVVTKTKAITTNTVSRRAGRILNGTPAISSRLGGGGSFGSSTGFSPVGFSGSGTLDNAKMAFSTSLRQVIGAGTKKKDAQRRELGKMMALGEQSLLSQYNNGLQPGFDVWVKGSLDHAKTQSRKSDLAMLFIGADYHLSSTTLVGVLAQFDWSDEKDTTNAFKTDGKGWMVGPYLATRLGKNLLFDGRASYGQSSNHISPLGTYEDSFDTTRWLVSGTLTGDFNMGGWRFSPHVGVTYFEETQKAYTDSIGINIAAQTVALGRMTFGPEVSTSFTASSGTVISPHIGIKGIWDFDKAQTIDLNTGLASGSDNELRASVEAGITTQFINGWRLAGEGHYDGIGDDNLEAYGGSVSLTVPLN